MYVPMCCANYHIKIVIDDFDPMACRVCFVPLETTLLALSNGILTSRATGAVYWAKEPEEPIVRRFV